MGTYWLILCFGTYVWLNTQESKTCIVPLMEKKMKTFGWWAICTPTFLTQLRTSGSPHSWTINKIQGILTNHCFLVFSNNKGLEAICAYLPTYTGGSRKSSLCMVCDLPQHSQTRAVTELGSGGLSGYRLGSNHSYCRGWRVFSVRNTWENGGVSFGKYPRKHCSRGWLIDKWNS